MEFNILKFIIYRTYFDNSKHLNKISKKYEYLEK